MTIHDFEAEKSVLLKDPDIRKAWLKYLDSFPHLSAYYRSTPLFKNQISLVNGKKAGSDINFYKLFLEQCLNLLRPGGRCGIIVPTSVYSDLGAKQLREVLFSECSVDAMFGFSNERFLFEGVHHSFKVCILVFEKGGTTEQFKAAFRMHPYEAIKADNLDNFLHDIEQHVRISVPLVRRLSPDSISVMEFRNDLDVQLAEKMFCFPLLGEKLTDTWNFRLSAEFHMTGDSKLFQTVHAPNQLPLYEGKMIHQFKNTLDAPRYWIEENAGRRSLIGRMVDQTQRLDYQRYRFACRSIARTTDTRTMIGTVLPPNVFAGHSLNVSRGELAPALEVYIAAILNSFVFDYALRQRVSVNVTLFYLYQLPVPRLTVAAPAFAPIVSRAARLICTTPEFDDLAAEAGLGSHCEGAKDAAERAALRAELDGLVAHLYGLSEGDFAHILATFPLVNQSVKDAALAAYREFAPNPDDAALAAIIAVGETARVEFKVAAVWNAFKGAKDDNMKDNIVRAVAAFLNTEAGAVILGVDDKGAVVGIGPDMLAADAKKPNPDGYELFLRNILSAKLGGDVAGLLIFSFHQIAGQPVARIAVKPSLAPVYTRDQGRLFVRAGNQSRELNPQEASAYVKRHWPSA